MEGHPEKYHFLLLPPRSQLIPQRLRRIARFHSVLLDMRWLANVHSRNNC